jgi:hypothetical protein
MSRSTRAAAKDTASLSAKSKKPSAGLLQLPSDGDNDNGNDIVPTSDIIATVMTDPKANKTKKRKPSAVVRDATTQKRSCAKKEQPTGTVPTYRPSEYASPMISTNIEGTRKSGRIITQTERGKKFYADSDDEDEPKANPKPSRFKKRVTRTNVDNVQVTKGGKPTADDQKKSRATTTDVDDAQPANLKGREKGENMDKKPNADDQTKKGAATKDVDNVQPAKGGNYLLDNVLDNAPPTKGGMSIYVLDNVDNANKGAATKDVDNVQSAKGGNYLLENVMDNVPPTKGGKSIYVMDNVDNVLDKKMPPLPSCTEGLFASDDFLSAIGFEAQQPKNNEYANVGITNKNSESSYRTKKAMPNYDDMSPNTKLAAKHEHSKGRKAEWDAQNRARRKECGGRAINWDKITYTGVNTPHLRTMDIVKEKRLKAGDNLIDKSALQLRIAEEANLRGIKIKWTTSTNSRVVVDGDFFHVVANLNETRGWVIKKASVRSGDVGVGDLDEVVDTDSEYEDDDVDGDDSHDDGDNDNKNNNGNNGRAGRVVSGQHRKLRSPITSVWLVPLIKSLITVKPNTSNSDLRHLLRCHCRTYALTRSVLQRARDQAKLEVFGCKEENAKYFIALRDELVARNHRVELMMGTYDDAISRMLLVVVADEKKRREEKKEQPFRNPDEAAVFAHRWMIDNDSFVRQHFGTKEENCKFILGILFSPVTSIGKVAYLQDLYQADAAHLDFGKYTFFSAYGSTANANAYLLAFGIIFGNEDKVSWTKFWQFVKEVHGEEDFGHQSTTIITDQDKGSKGAIADVFPHVANFHCSWHRRSNILKASMHLVVSFLVCT